ncbi:MAG TPA: hypothetical protein DHW39_01715 [Erysipelotrichaceae bacterium]|nr:hypothetical protein [Erysipelotrichaceae bacterium]
MVRNQKEVVMSKLLSDPEIMKLIIFGLAGVCAVLMLAVLFLAVKRNIYYVDENGEEIIPISKKELKKRKVAEKTKPAEPAEEAQPEPVEVPQEEAAAVPEEELMQTMVVPSQPEENSESDELEIPAMTSSEEPVIEREIPLETTAPGVKGVRIRVNVSGKSAEYAVDHLPCLIGRETGTCDLTISEPAISRRHARLALADNKVFIEDVSEHNGTFLNGTKLPSLGSAELHEGDRIALGRAEITVLSFIYEE